MKPIKNTNSFGRRLRDCRQAKGLSQSDLAAILKTSNKMISRYERDEMKPSIEVALKLAKELETSISYLAGEVRYPRDKESESILDDLNSIPESERNKIKTTIHSLVKLSRSGEFSN